MTENNERMPYEGLEMLVVKFECADIVCTSEPPIKETDTDI